MEGLGRLPYDRHSSLFRHHVSIISFSVSLAYSNETYPPATSTVTVTPAKDDKEKEKEKEGNETDISQAYQIFPDEVLGSGQFGIVYGGVHR